MSQRVRGNNEILMLTAGLAGGSFMALKQLAESSSKLTYTIIGLGYYTRRIKNTKIIAIPFFRYDGYIGHITAKYQLLNFLVQIPLYIFAAWHMITRRPAAVIFNGFATMLPLLVIARMCNIRIVLSFRSWWDTDRFHTIETIVKKLLRSVDLAYVNSTGTAKNLSKMINKERIIVIPHHAHKTFFKQKNRCYEPAFF